MPPICTPQKSAILQISPSRPVASLWRILIVVRGHHSTLIQRRGAARCGSALVLWRWRLRPAGVKRPFQTFEGHQHFLALRFVETDCAHGLLKERLQFGFGSVSGPVRHCRSFRPWCCSRALEQRRSKPHPSGPQRQRRSFTLATRTAAINDRQRTNTDGRGTAGATLTRSRQGIRTAASPR